MKIIFYWNTSPPWTLTQDSLSPQYIIYISIYYLCHSIQLECDFWISHLVLYRFQEAGYLLVFLISGMALSRSKCQIGGAIFDTSPFPHLPNPIHHQILKLLPEYFWNPHCSLLTIINHNQSKHHPLQLFLPHRTVRKSSQINCHRYTHILLSLICSFNHGPSNHSPMWLTKLY